MYQVRKAWWGLRAVALKPFFGSLALPSYIGPTTFIVGSRRIFIGRRARIFPGLRAEAYEGGRILIGENVALEQSVHITAMGDLKIGSGTAVLGFTTITDIEHEYTDVGVPVLSQKHRYGRTEIGPNCFIGMGARIQAGTILGEGCVVGANAVVRGTFPPHCVIVGVPGRVVKQYNVGTGIWHPPN